MSVHVLPGGWKALKSYSSFWIFYSFILFSKVNWNDMSHLIGMYGTIFFCVAISTTYLYTLKQLLFLLAGYIHLEIDRKTFRIKLECLGFSRQIELETQKISDFDISKNANSITNFEFFTIQEGKEKHTFKICVSKPEKEWLLAEIFNFLIKTKSIEQ
jgi:hypothetical protein